MPTSNIDFDALLVDWLYGELDSADTERFEKHLETHPEDAAEAAAMRRVRAYAKKIDQAEPPANLTTILMHEAASRAESNKGGAGLWAAITGFFQPVFMHPAASAMASFVLVVGVAGVLYMRNGSDMIAEPRADSSAAAPTSIASNQAEAKSAARPASGAPEPLVAADEFQEKEESEGDSSGSEKGGQSGFSVDVLDDDRESSLARARVKRAPQSKSDKGTRAPKKPKAKLAKSGTTKSPFGSVSTNAVSGSNRGYMDGKDEETAIGSIRSGGGSNTGKKSVSNKPGRIVVEEQSWEATKASTFRAAAKSKKCSEAGRIANDIRDRKPDYYKSSIAGTKEESDCRYSIVTENKRRAKQRVARKAKKSKKRATSKQGNSVPKKATAAPQDEALAEPAEEASGL